MSPKITFATRIRLSFPLYRIFLRFAKQAYVCVQYVEFNVRVAHLPTSTTPCCPCLLLQWDVLLWPTPAIHNPHLHNKRRRRRGNWIELQIRDCGEWINSRINWIYVRPLISFSIEQRTSISAFGLTSSLEEDQQQQQHQQLMLSWNSGR